MAKLRKFVAYRRLDARPYTRRSKYRAKSYVRSSPHNRIVRYVMGESTGVFPITISLQADANLQIRDNALEAARQLVLRRLEKSFGKTGYRFSVDVYPHHILRENPLASGAGADRMSTGMKMSFGKVIGIAARITKGQSLYTIRCTKEKLSVAKTALERAATKLPCACRVIIT